MARASFGRYLGTDSSENVFASLPKELGYLIPLWNVCVTVQVVSLVAKTEGPVGKAARAKCKEYPVIHGTEAVGAQS